ncbi:Piso0_005354 [Millerozyma farinosa CBS 7064]|uniref:Piso0_005354 protein n=1 Tax=Pichia sorbitophila (strain ATCC MYA-4447 / BCRC 22081 / CBS 7064 / NBRC 10061 / NRRL Y-12695) TaxID=559304 RepID=G8Y4W4_PICSO|nr:Piso0_005354 [Millerozyma farinosa CBS 7064]
MFRWRSIVFLSALVLSVVVVLNSESPGAQHVRVATREGYFTAMEKLEPAYEKIAPVFHSIEEKVGARQAYSEYVSPHLSVIAANINSVREKAAESKELRTVEKHLKSVYKRLVKGWKLSVYPWIEVNTVKVLQRLELVSLQLQWRVRQLVERKEVSDFVTSIKGFFTSRCQAVKSSEVCKKIKYYYRNYGVEFVVEQVKKFFLTLINSKTAHDKINFLKSEFSNLGFFRPEQADKENSHQIPSIVKNILEEVTSIYSSISTGALPKSSSKTVSEDGAAQTDTMSTIPTTDIVKPSESTESPEEAASYNDDSEQEQVEQYDPYSDEEGYYEPETVQYTSTITVVQEDSIETSADLAKNSQLEELINYWDRKINRTLEVSLMSLTNDMSVVINNIIENAKGEVTKNLTYLQKVNYDKYRELNYMIHEIEKDASLTIETGVIVNSTNSERDYFDRQAMRDKIQETLETCEKSISSVEKYLSEKHEEVSSIYFDKLQENFDIFDSFAELSVQEFSSKLHSLLNMLESENELDETIGWHAWKKFHHIKSNLYEARDRLFEQAYDFHETEEPSSIPDSLVPWKAYVANIKYHLGYLERDNDNYLKIVRAKANVAYQAREKAVRDVIESQSAPKNTEAEANDDSADAADAHSSSEHSEQVQSDSSHQDRYEPLSDDSDDNAERENDDSAENDDSDRDSEQDSDDDIIHVSSHCCPRRKCGDL